MPKRKPQAKANTTAKKTNTQCLTLHRDGKTRCANPPTHGSSPQDRCLVHHKQFSKMLDKYKDASNIVNDVLEGSIMPTKDEILCNTNFHSALNKARWIHRYVEAIRVEKIGLEIHEKRFFLKVEDRHKNRLKLLAKQMTAAVQILGTIQERAFDLHIKDHPAYRFIKEFQEALPTKRPGSSEKDVIPDAATDAERRTEVTILKNQASDGNEDDDLIDMEIRAEKAKLLSNFEPLLEREARAQVKESKNPDLLRQETIVQNITAQYARRSLFRDPVLCLKALNKSTFRDLLLNDDFSLEDARRLADLWGKQLEFGLSWMKEATIEAIAMYPSAQKPPKALKDVVNRRYLFPIVGGEVFIEPTLETMTNEAWWVRPAA